MFGCMWSVPSFPSHRAHIMIFISHLRVEAGQCQFIPWFTHFERSKTWPVLSPFHWRWLLSQQNISSNECLLVLCYRWGGSHMDFPERIEAVLTWSELKWTEVKWTEHELLILWRLVHWRYFIMPDSTHSSNLLTRFYYIILTGSDSLTRFII